MFWGLFYAFTVVISTLTVITSTTDEVITISGENFEDELSKHEIVLVLFYSPGCGHCSKLAPEFVKAASVLRHYHPPITLAKIDCTTEEGKPVCLREGVKGFPTLKTYMNGKLEFEYDGPRDAGGMVAYMKGKVKPPDVELATSQDFERYVDSLENCVIGFFDTEDSPLEAEFHKLARSQAGQYRFARTSNDRLMNRFGYRNDIVIFRSDRLSTKLEPDQVKYEGAPRLYELRNWLVNNYHGLVGYRTALNRDQFLAPLTIIYLNVTDLSDRLSQSRYWRNRFMMAAKKFTEGRRRVTFAVSDALEFRRELSDFGLKYDPSADQPLITARDSEQKRYAFINEFSVENVELFVTNMINGHLTPYIRSQAPPPDPDVIGSTNDGQASGIVVVVAKTFNQIVNDPKKDVFLMFESPTCGRCRTIEKTWTKVKEKLSKADDVVFAKMDAEANEVFRPYYLKGFPTIFFVPSTSKSSPKFYEEGYEVKDFIKYLAKETTSGLQNYERSGKKKKEQKNLKDEL